MSFKKRIPSTRKNLEKDRFWISKKIDRLAKENEEQSIRVEEQSIRIEEQSSKIDRLSDVIEANAKSSADHISLLANFARHDVANYIQNMDAILNTTTIDSVSTETFERLQSNIQSIREVMSNFAALAPHSEDGVFSITQLIGAAESMNRALLVRNGVRLIKEYPDIEINMKFPFQALLQVINNMISNACKPRCYPDQVGYEKKIKLSYALKGSMLSIRIFDNGVPISEGDKENIFKYGYTNTGGSGIGLFHAEYICNLLKGDVTIEDQDDGVYTKCFCINLPVKERAEDA